MSNTNLVELPEGITQAMLDAVKFTRYELACNTCVNYIRNGWTSFPSHNESWRGRHAGHCTCDGCW